MCATLPLYASEAWGICFLQPSGRLPSRIFTRVESYVVPDNAWELDGLAEDGERWAVEVRWRNRRADYSDASRLHARGLDLNARPWLITRSGLTASAAEYVREKGILVSTERELQALAERLGMRFAK